MMDIISKLPADQKVWERVASLDLPKKFNSLSADGRLTRLEQIYDIPVYKATANISTFINKILTMDNHDQMPSVIKFCYSEMEDSGVDPQDVTDLLNASYSFTCKRLKCKKKNFILSGHTHKQISKDYHSQLVNSGFRGGVFSILKNSPALYVEKQKYWKSNMDWWEDGIVSNVGVSNIITLTYRQSEVLHYIVRCGLTNAQIAKELKVSEQAIKLHVSAIMKKYGVRNRTQLALFAKAKII